MEGPGARVWVAAGVFVLLLAGVVSVVALRGPTEFTGEVGQLDEPVIELADGTELPWLVDATERWGLAAASASHPSDQMAGGAVAADATGDGQLDLVVANGDVVVWPWNGDRFGRPVTLPVDAAIGVTAADLDRDGRVDLLIARSEDDDIIVWGGSEAQTVLAGQGASSNLLAVDMNGDGHLDVVRLGRGMEKPEPDVLWIGDGQRGFDPEELPVVRYTLAGAIVDADDDGLLDIWLTRDVGWIHGPDSILSRAGGAGTGWVDVAAELGADRAIDGMGITVADLDGDGSLDAYLSDLGDNELLVGIADGFRTVEDHGAARIRPPGADNGVVSSSWSSGPIDANLDGVLDLIVVGGGFPIGNVRNKIEGTEVAVAEPPSLLLGRGDGTYRDVWPELGLEVELTARGMTVADFDGDGDDDFVVVGRLGELVAIENQTVHASLTVKPGPSCRGLGATIQVGDHIVLVDRHGYAGQHAPDVIVGVSKVVGGELGDAVFGEVTVDVPGRPPQLIAGDVPAPVGEERTSIDVTCS